MKTLDNIINSILEGDFPNLKIKFASSIQTFFINEKFSVATKYYTNSSGYRIYPILLINFKDHKIEANFGSGSDKSDKLVDEIDFDAALEWLDEFGGRK